MILAVLAPVPAIAAEPAVGSTPNQRVAISWDGEVESVDIELSPGSPAVGYIFASPAKAEVSAGDPSLFSELDALISPRQLVQDDWWGRAQEDLGEPESTQATPVSDVEPTTINASNSSALSKWLRANDLEVSDAAATSIAQYGSDGWRLTLLKLDAAGAVGPIRIQFVTDQPIFPIRLAAASESAVEYRMFAFGQTQTEFRQWPRIRREVNVARKLVWAGSTQGSTLADRGAFLTVTDLRFDAPASQIIGDLALVESDAVDELIPTVPVYRPIELLGFPLGWLIVVWGGIGALIGVGYLANRFRAH